MDNNTTAVIIFCTVLILCITFALYMYSLHFTTLCSYYFPVRKAKNQLKLQGQSLKALQKVKVRRETGLGKDFTVMFTLLQYVNSKATIKSNVNKHSIFLENLKIEICLEHFIPLHLNAKKYIYIPNQEFVNIIDKTNLKLHKKKTIILCKTNASIKYFNKYFPDFTMKLLKFPYIFADKNNLNTYNKDKSIFLHPAGASTTKNTLTVLEVWAKNPHLPTLVVTSKVKKLYNFYKQLLKTYPCKNVVYKNYIIADKEFKNLQQKAFCVVLPSSCEGFGYSLFEAINNRSLLITTNEQPMNEIIDSNKKNIFYVKSIPKKMTKLCFNICPESLLQQIQKVMNLSIENAKSITKTNLELLINENKKKALDYELYLFKLCEPRLEYYLNKGILDIPPERKLTLKSIDQNKSIKNKKISNMKHNVQFINILIWLIRANNADPKLLPPYSFHDCSQFDGYKDILFVKARSVLDTNGILLQRYKFGRHWGKYYNPPKDISFNLKKNKLYWRGASTGKSHEQRLKFVKLYFNNPKCNIGINANIYDDNRIKKYMRLNTSPSQFLKNKYIMSIEGNDKDSGLQWKLNSNSVVFMTKPTKVSWLMEDTLVPGKHYVLIKDDFSDIKEKIDWCDKNPRECQKISQNAKKFMSQFKNLQYEKIIEYYIMKYYLTKINLI